jgi:uridylate kinase
MAYLDKETRNARQRQRWKEDAAFRARHTVDIQSRRYGLTKEQVEVAFVSGQGDFCAACQTFARLVIDHNHATGRARGMVCTRCNQIAGALEDTKVDRVRRYLCPA